MNTGKQSNFPFKTEQTKTDVSPLQAEVHGSPGLSAPNAVRCKFDKRTGILHIHIDGGSTVVQMPTDAEFMQLFAHQAKGAEIKGIVVFSGRRDHVA